MGLFDVFTGQPQKDAAASSQATMAALYPQVVGSNAGARTEAADYLHTGASGALGFLKQGQQGGLEQLGGARADLKRASDEFLPLSELGSRYSAGAKLYADTLGINGPEGNTRATDAFHASPGYDYAVKQAIEGVNRSQNARGMLNSGNTDAAAMDRAHALADQDYGNWRTSLQGFQPLELSATGAAATGRAGADRSLADLGVTGAGLIAGGGRDMAGVAGAEGAALAGNVTNSNNAMTGATLNMLPQWTGSFKQAADAQTAGSANLWGLGMQGAKLAAGAAGGAGGGSFMPSSSFMNNSWGW